MTDKEVINAQIRVPLGKLSSNTARVTDAAATGAGVAEATARGAGECGREGSGNDMDGNDDVGDDDTFSQFGEPVRSAAAAAAAGGLCAVCDGAGCDCVSFQK